MAQQVVVIEPDYFSVSVTAPQTVTISNTGPQGAKGDTGATGPQGIQGPTGATGAPGVVQTVSGTSPITATGTTAITVGINQGSITIAESQVTNLVTDLAAKAPLASPALTGTPTSTTAALTTSTTQIATTAFVDQNTGDIRQFAADKSVLQNIPARIHPAEQLLKQAVFWIDSNHSSAANQTVTNLGWGGSVLDATAGSSGSADSNDPKFLSWDGTNYVYLPGNVASNFLNVTSGQVTSVTGDIDIRVQAALDTWTPSTSGAFIGSTVGDPNRRFRFNVNTTGNLNLTWWPTGLVGSQIAVNSTAATGFSAGQTAWVRVTLDVDNGASGNTVTFYTSTDGVNWVQLGSSVVTAGTTSIYAANADYNFYGNVGLDGKLFRAQILNGINGTPVLDVDTSLITSGSNTSFTALTGQTVTINRSTSGRKSVAVTHPCYLLGTDDYFQVADNDLLDFGATDSFTVLAVVRRWNTQASQSIVAKKGSATSTQVGYALTSDTTDKAYGYISDGTTQRSTNVSYTSGPIAVLAMVRTAQVTIASFNGNTAGTSLSDTTTGTLANTGTLNIGRYSSGGGFGDMEFVAAAIFRRVLTAAEITTLNNYYQGQAA